MELVWYELVTITVLRHKFNIHRSVHRYYIRRVQLTRCKVSQFIYSYGMLYMFQTGFTSIIRSSKLHIQCQVLV